MHLDAFETAALQFGRYCSRCAICGKMFEGGTSSRGHDAGFALLRPCGQE